MIDRETFEVVAVVIAAAGGLVGFFSALAAHSSADAAKDQANAVKAQLPLLQSQVAAAVQQAEIAQRQLAAVLDEAERKRSEKEQEQLRESLRQWIVKEAGPPGWVVTVPKLWQRWQKLAATLDPNDSTNGKLLAVNESFLEFLVSQLIAEKRLVFAPVALVTEPHYTVPESPLVAR